MQHIKTPVPWLRTRNSNATAELSELLQVAMAKDPDKRHSSVEEFLGQLRSIKMLESVPEMPDSDETHAE